MNPTFGNWPDRDGDTARPIRARISLSEGGRRRSGPRCPSCGAVVEWTIGRHGATVVLEGGRVHVCSLDAVLARHEADGGAETLEVLRRAINERRMHGAAV